MTLIPAKQWKVVLQPLRWCCVDCVIHLKRDVREEQKYVCVEQASNNKRDCGAWSLLFLAATVRNFELMPLGFPIATVDHKNVIHSKSKQIHFNMAYKECDLKWVLSQVNVVSNKCGLKSMWSQNECGLKWMWSQMNVVSNECGLKWMWSQMNVVPNECCPKWMWSQMNVVSNECGLKRMWAQMNVGSNECSLKWKNLIWMWSQKNRSQMK